MLVLQNTKRDNIIDISSSSVETAAKNTCVWMKYYSIRVEAINIKNSSACRCKMFISVVYVGIPGTWFLELCQRYLELAGYKPWRAYTHIWKRVCTQILTCTCYLYISSDLWLVLALCWWGDYVHCLRVTTYLMVFIRADIHYLLVHV